MMGSGPSWERKGAYSIMSVRMGCSPGGSYGNNDDVVGVGCIRWKRHLLIHGRRKESTIMARRLCSTYKRDCEYVTLNVDKLGRTQSAKAVAASHSPFT